MRIIKSNGSARLFGFSLAWQCVRCKSRKSVTSYTPLQYVDLKVFDAAIHLFFDSFSTTVGNKLCRTSVSRYFRCFRMACSTYIKNKILPYLQLPGPVEIDESKISA